MGFGAVLEQTNSAYEATPDIKLGLIREFSKFTKYGFAVRINQSGVCLILKLQRGAFDLKVPVSLADSLSFNIFKLGAFLGLSSLESLKFLYNVFYSKGSSNLSIK